MSASPWTAALDLSAGTTYTYTAHGDSSCSTTALDTVTFSTILTVSNIDKAPFGTGPVGKESSSDRRAAQRFTTGPHNGGYTLTSVTIDTAAKIGAPAAFTATLNASGNIPGAALVTLSGSDPDTAGSHTFTCAGSGCNLAADTSYFIVMSASGSAGEDNHYLINTTQSRHETLVPSGNGWSIANGSFTRQGGIWTPYPTTAYKLKVSAAPK